MSEKGMKKLEEKYEAEIIEKIFEAEIGFQIRDGKAHDLKKFIEETNSISYWATQIEKSFQYVPGGQERYEWLNFVAKTAYDLAFEAKIKLTAYQKSLKDLELKTCVYGVNHADKSDQKA